MKILREICQIIWMQEKTQNPFDVTGLIIVFERKIIVVKH